MSPHEVGMCNTSTEAAAKWLAEAAIRLCCQNYAWEAHQHRYAPLLLTGFNDVRCRAVAHGISKIKTAPDLVDTNMS
jgi:hypothetical protein